MAPLRFAANLNWLFQELSTLPQRMEAASRAGFRAAEMGLPYSCGAQQLREAADRAGLEVVLINTPPGNQAAAILKKVGSPNLKLQLDIFHCQIMDGNLTENIKTYFPIIGHIQIAQVPERHEPDSPGELDYSYLFQLLETMGYSGYVGCEYAPKGDTVNGLGWLHSYWKSHDVLHSES